MPLPSPYVARLSRTADWTYVADGVSAGSAHATCRPDGRWFVAVDAWDAAPDEPLLAAMAADLRSDLYTVVDAADEPELDRWRRLGFTPARRELLLRVPVDPATTGLRTATGPSGIVLLPADAVDERELRELDDRLRQDVPGSTGWRNDPMEFRDWTFDERSFDPSTYLVAVDDGRQTFAGLVRVWTAPPRHRLGLIGVVPTHRRRGLARALLGQAFAVLHDRGVAAVAAEVDETNTPSRRLLEGLGATPTGVSVELVRRT